jgi:hypothetical protein
MARIKASFYPKGTTMKRNHTIALALVTGVSGFLLARSFGLSLQKQEAEQKAKVEAVTEETTTSASPLVRQAEAYQVVDAKSSASNPEGKSPTEKQVESSPAATVATESTGDGTTANVDHVEAQLQGNLLKDEKVQKEAEINGITCTDKGCTIEASARKDDDSHFQMAFVEFLQAHPEFGNKIDIKPSPDNPRNVAFVYYKD